MCDEAKGCCWGTPRQVIFVEYVRKIGRKVFTETQKNANVRSASVYLNSSPDFVPADADVWGKFRVFSEEAGNTRGGVEENASLAQSQDAPKLFLYYKGGADK